MGGGDDWGEWLADVLGTPPEGIKPFQTIDLRHLGNERARRKREEKLFADADKARAKREQARKMSEGEERFLKLWKRYGDPAFGMPRSEVKLVPGRRFRTEFYFPVGTGLIVEVEGMLARKKNGQIIKGQESRHRSITGMMRDARKYNLIQREGVFVYRIPSWWLKGGYQDTQKIRLRPRDFIAEINGILRQLKARQEAIEQTKRAMKNAADRLRESNAEMVGELEAALQALEVYFGEDGD